MKFNEAVKSVPDVHSGEVCFTDTRVPVDALFDCLEAGESVEGFRRSFPAVRQEQIYTLLSTMRRATKRQALEGAPPSQ